jgi:tRNA A-37 threonylcarbamoyl transferase component Bud32
MPRQTCTDKIESFNFQPGRVLANKYEVITKLGEGWEGEVFLVREKITSIERAAKFFYPQRNPNNKAFIFYARKLHKLRHCPILIQYLTQETIVYKGQSITFLVSDFVEGELLSEYIARQRGQHLSSFEALHLLHALAAGIETIHHLREYHGDLHTDNIIIRRQGLSYEVKLLDMFHWGAATREHLCNDVVDLIRIFYDAIGGRKCYARQPREVKAICCGLKRSLILKKFRTAGQLREYLETMKWDV